MFCSSACIFQPPSPSSTPSQPLKKRCYSFSLLSVYLFYSPSQEEVLLSLCFCLPAQEMAFLLPLLCQPAPAEVLCRSEHDNDITRTVLLSIPVSIYHPSIHPSSLLLPFLIFIFFLPPLDCVSALVRHFALYVISFHLSVSSLSSSLLFTHPPFSSFPSLCLLLRGGGVVSPPEQHSSAALTASLSGREEVLTPPPISSSSPLLHP